MSETSEDQAVRLQDMLEFDSDDDFYEQVFDAYKRIHQTLPKDTVLLFHAANNYEFYWNFWYPGTAKEAAKFLGLRHVSEKTHNQAWFKASRTAMLDKLKERWTVRFMDHVDGEFVLLES